MDMHAGYFDATAAPGLSLLETGSALGFRVWAPDRPGTRASVDLAGEHRLIRPQADLLLEALDTVVADGPIGAGVFVVGHSYGAKVAIGVVARGGERQFLGLDINGVGSGLGHGLDEPTDRMRYVSVRGDRGPSWGPPALYPHGAISRARLPMAASHPLPFNETLLWPTDFAEFAPMLRMPVRLTYGDHERWWPIDDDSIGAMWAKFTAAPSVAVHMEQGGGHNLSLGTAAASYHRAVFAFAEECIGGAVGRSETKARRA